MYVSFLKSGVTLVCVLSENSLSESTRSAGFRVNDDPEKADNLRLYNPGC